MRFFCRSSEGRKYFFFEKKKQKTFICFGPLPAAWMARRWQQRTKVFWFFFSKKNCFLGASPPPR
jgi:hypothetical protein